MSIINFRSVEKLGFESIKPQNPDFFRVLTGLCEVAIASLENGESYEAALSDISDAITKRTGINVLLVNREGIHVYIPALKKNHALLTDIQKQYISTAKVNKLVREKQILKGSVDVKNAKVSGIFSEGEYIIHVGEHDVAICNFTPAELAAIIMHEVGHLFTYFEHLTIVASDNVLLHAVNEKLAGNPIPDKRDVIIIDAGKAAGMSAKEIEELCKVDDDRIVQLEIHKKILEQSRSEHGFDYYDVKVYEIAADDFASKFGGARHLATSLDKFYKLAGDIQARSTGEYLAIEVFKAFMLVSWGALSVMGGPATLAVFGSWLYFIITPIALSMKLTAPHETPFNRLNSIKAMLISNLKDRKLSKEESDLLHEDLVIIEKVISEYTDREGWFTSVLSFLRSDLSKFDRQKKLSQELTSLQYNDLFVSADKFKNLIK